MIPIITTPNSILVKKSDKVERFDKKLKNLVSQMEETLLATTDPKGVGLAAPQVGISLRIFQIKPTEKSKVLTFINPEIVPSPATAVSAEASQPGSLANARSAPKNSKGKLLEGCLSIPNIWGNVTRKKEVTVKWQDENGKEHTKSFKGFSATIIQHELDHLNGILFTKHVLEQNEQLYRSHKNEDGEDEFEEINV